MPQGLPPVYLHNHIYFLKGVIRISIPEMVWITEHFIGIFLLFQAIIMMVIEKHETQSLFHRGKEQSMWLYKIK